MKFECFERLKGIYENAIWYATIVFVKKYIFSSQWFDCFAFQREALLSGSSDVHRKIQSQQQAVKASQGVTDSLRRTREQMAQQIELTDGNLEILGG